MTKKKEKSFDELVNSIPRKIATADVFMNLHKLPPQHGRQLEAADKVETQGEGDSLMGRLAMRMASRDMIDELNLGPKGKSPEAKKAAVADMKYPTKMHIEGPADLNLNKAIKIEKEHKSTVDTIKKNSKLPNKEIYKKIATDHIKEHPKYYDEKKGLPAMERKLENADNFKNSIPSKMLLGAGLHQQTADIKASNMQDTVPTEKVRKGANMADQARAAGNVFNTMNTVDIEQQKSLPKLFKK